ncbi:MAG: TonB-dependent receptor plug [Lacunisphaera sp.]|nr:TonB-dependent receptor plug [Lacunisphaera sp.]
MNPINTMNINRSAVIRLDRLTALSAPSGSRRALLPFLTCLAFTVSFAAHAFGQIEAPAVPAPSPETISLPRFTVTGEQANQYRATDQISAARTVGHIMDTPMSVSVITPALLQDIGPQTMFDVTRYFGGVSPGRGTGAGGINDRQTFRGFESFSRTWDNFSGFLFPGTAASGANIDPVFVEHAELLMGPDSILAPTGTPGGSINLITKSPKFDRSTDATLEFGNYNANKYTVDTTGPIGDGKHMAYRVIGAYQDSKLYMPGAVRNFSGSAQLTYTFSDTAQVTFKYFGNEQDTMGTAAQSNLDGEQIYTADTVGGATLSNTPQPGFAYTGWNGDAYWSRQLNRSNIAQAEFTSSLGDKVNMRLAAQILYSSFNVMMAFPTAAKGTLTEAWDPATGQQISVTPINTSALPEIGAWEHSTSRQIQVQNDYAGKYELGGATLQPVLGWTYQQGSNPVNFYLQDKNMPTADLAAGIYNPPQPPLSEFTSVALNQPSSGWVAQAYAFMSASFFHNRLFASGGVSRTWAQVNDYSYPGIYLPTTGQVGSTAAGTNHTFANTGSLITPTTKPRHDTYMGGLLYKVRPNVSAYYSYSTNASVAGAIPLWQAGVQHEFGLKGEFLNKRIMVSADHFQIVESNVSATNPLYNIGLSTIPNIYSNLRNHGEELNIVGGLTKNLSLIMSYTQMHLRDAAGRRQRNIPDNMANALLNYRFTEGLLKNANFFVGVIHQGNVAGETVGGYTSLGVPEQPGFYVAPYTVVNAGAGYKWGRYHFNLNVDNALNQKFWWQASSRTSLYPYAGLTARFTVTIHL